VRVVGVLVEMRPEQVDARGDVWSPGQA
jgi:hypothetical protein